MACLSDDEMVGLAAGSMSPDERPEVERHLDGCADCRRVLAEALQAAAEEHPSGLGADTPSGRVAPLRAGSRVGRFEIVDLVGAGASGRVYRARDPELGRHVAVKVLRPDIADPELAAAWRKRLLLEAQAMARLNHPNVVVVHEAGATADEVFIAMELVEGESLADWLRRPGRSWREILDVFLEVGRGVEAAHQAGLVHGDFKPANVVLGADGRPRIADFGLARRSRPESPARTPQGERLVSGTPLYMAPEQLAGGEADARSDQFSFCVAGFEALYGTHPFAGSAGAPASLLHLSAATLKGEIAARNRDQPVPRRIYDVLARGLAREPQARHPSMAALGRALASGARSLTDRTVRRLVWAGAALCLAALGAAAIDRMAAAPRCGNGAREAGEECDDGNAGTADVCLPTCRLARCGDGVLRTTVEECDDGNLVDGDGCTSVCLTCPAEAATGHGGRCTQGKRTLATWSEARAACLESGGDLVTFRDGSQTPAVTPSHMGGGRFWIGLALAPGETQPQWVDEDGPAGPGPWRQAQGAGDCFALGLTSGPGPPEAQTPSWQRAPCRERAFSVCEKRGWVVRPADGHAYKMVFDRVLWSVAVERCRQLGAHLVTVEDEAEQGLVVGLMNGAFWMGGSDAREEGAFEWITGRPMTFARFAPGEPNDQNGDNDCLGAKTHDGLWRDWPCWLLRSYLCELE